MKTMQILLKLSFELLSIYFISGSEAYFEAKDQSFHQMS